MVTVLTWAHRNMHKQCNGPGSECDGPSTRKTPACGASRATDPFASASYRRRDSRNRQRMPKGQVASERLSAASLVGEPRQRTLIFDPSAHTSAAR